MNGHDYGGEILPSGFLELHDTKIEAGQWCAVWGVAVCSLGGSGVQSEKTYQFLTLGNIALTKVLHA